MIAGPPQNVLIEDRETIFFSKVVFYIPLDFRQSFPGDLPWLRDLSCITPFVFLFAFDMTRP